MTELALRVAAIDDAIPGIRRIRLVPQAGGLLPAFSAGAHLVLAMRDGPTLRRNPYSLCSDPEDRSGYDIAVRRAERSRGGSAFLHDRLAVGDLLSAGQPANLFQPDWRGRRHVMVAGGIGITPFMAMTATFDRMGLPFELHYACRSRATAAFADLLAARYGGRVTLYPSDEGRRIDLAAVVGDQPLGTQLYTCGPDGLMAAALQAARDAGWPDQALHAERFEAPPPGDPFTVTLARTGTEVRVGRDQSLLEALEAAGIAAPCLCRGGACGECATRVIEARGTILHNDHFLSPAERAAGDRIMTCMSRFTGDRLVLDL